MPCLKEKKVSGLYERPENNLSQKHYNMNFTPDEDISEPSPEDHPEDLSIVDFEISRNEPLQNCPDCDGKIEEITTGGIDPQDTVDILTCPSCGWTDRKLFSEMTLKEVFNNLEEVCF